MDSVQLAERLEQAEDKLARLQRERAELERGTLATLLECALDACYLLRAVRAPDGSIDDFVFTGVNTPGETLLGQPREVIEGARLCELYPFHRAVSPLTGTSLLQDYAGVHERKQPLRRELEVPNLPTGVMWYAQHVVATAEGVAMMTRDITRDKVAHRVQVELEQRAQRAQTMESLGMLAGGVAHDFNNLLLAIGGFAELAKQKIRDDPERAADSLEHVLAATLRAAELTRQLLVLSDRRQPVSTAHDLGAMVQGNMRLIGSLLARTVNVRLDLSDAPLVVVCNEPQIAQVLLNLCLNARDAMPDGGDLTVRTVRARLDPGSADLNPGEVPGEVARLQVTDTGHGIDDSALPHIFEPFYTTKEIGKGTGLGLALVYSIVRRHHGAVRVRSAPGAGTTFTVDLPLAGAAPYQVPAEAPPAAGRQETILIVDDETAVRVLLSAALERAGYQALVAGSGREAVEVLKRAGAHVDLVILDAVMPGMDGHQTYTALRALRPEVRVLFTTAHERAVFPVEFFQNDAHPLLRKPFDVQTLLRAVRAVLDPHPGSTGR